jgi:hypothetical protein
MLIHDKVYRSLIHNIIVARSIQQHNIDLLFGILGDGHGRRLYIGEISIKVYDSNWYLQVSQQGHNLNLISLPVYRLNFGLAEHIDRHTVVYKCFV